MSALTDPQGAHPTAPPDRTRRIALVLAGGAARGAYEVGVVRYVVQQVANELAREVPIDILCGTSAGSINACMLAALADEPRARVDLLAARWTSLRVDQVVKASPSSIWRAAGRLVGMSPDLGLDPRAARRGGVLDPSGIEEIVRAAIPFERIAYNIARGHLHAVSISTTHVASGRTVVWVQKRGGGAPRWGGDPTIVGRPAELRAEHVLASAALPLLFPAVAIDGQYYCDGGLRQNVPLSPGRRLGADSLLVINPRFIRDEQPTVELAESRESSYPDPLFVVGKAMNALLLDRIENDIDRLLRLNAVLEAGTRRYGPSFGASLNEELATLGFAGLRPLDVAYVRASEDIGVMAAEYVQSPAFSARVGGLLGRALRKIADGATEADLLSYVLFDGEFCGRLVELGWSDAKARHKELVRLFARRCEGP